MQPQSTRRQDIREALMARRSSARAVLCHEPGAGRAWAQRLSPSGRRKVAWASRFVSWARRHFGDIHPKPGPIATLRNVSDIRLTVASPVHRGRRLSRQFLHHAHPSSPLPCVWQVNSSPTASQQSCIGVGNYPGRQLPRPTTGPLPTFGKAVSVCVCRPPGDLPAHLSIYRRMHRRRLAVPSCGARGICASR